MLSEDESASVLNKISFIEDYKTSAISQGRREIEASIQHSTALREQLQRSSIENFEAHVERVAEINPSRARQRTGRIRTESICRLCKVRSKI